MAITSKPIANANWGDSLTKEDRVMIIYLYYFISFLLPYRVLLQLHYRKYNIYTNSRTKWQNIYQFISTKNRINRQRFNLNTWLCWANFRIRLIGRLSWRWILFMKLKTQCLALMAFLWQHIHIQAQTFGHGWLLDFRFRRIIIHLPSKGKIDMRNPTVFSCTPARLLLQFSLAIKLWTFWGFELI